MSTLGIPFSLSLMISVVSIASCHSGTEKHATECMVSDRVTFLKSFVITDKTYHLYERRSGFADKMSYLEFYDVQPDFDQCGEANRFYVSQVPVDDMGNDPVRIVVKDMVIDVVYGEKPYSSPDLATLPIEVR